MTISKAQFKIDPLNFGNGGIRSNSNVDTKQPSIRIIDVVVVKISVWLFIKHNRVFGVLNASSDLPIAPQPILDIRSNVKKPSRVNILSKLEIIGFSQCHRYIEKAIRSIVLPGSFIESDASPLQCV